MKCEVYSAADFIANLLRVGHASSLNELQLMAFRDTLIVMMRNHYQNHWFPDRPFKGSGYRCIRINGQMDPLVASAGEACGMPPAHLRALFPSELTMWVDPWEVSYRIGENGSICVLLDSKTVMAAAAASASVPESEVSISASARSYSGSSCKTVPSPAVGQRQWSEANGAATSACVFS